MNEKIFIEVGIKIIENNKLDYFIKASEEQKIKLLKDSCSLMENRNLRNIIIPSKLNDLSFYRDQMINKLCNIANYRDLENPNMVIYNLCQVSPLSYFFFADPSLYLTKRNFDYLASTDDSILSNFYYGLIDLFEHEISLSNVYSSFILPFDKREKLKNEIYFLDTNCSNENSSFLSQFFENLSEKTIILNKLI